MHQYPSDITREEYEQIREDLEGARKKTRPRPTLRKEVSAFRLTCKEILSIGTV